MKTIKFRGFYKGEPVYFTFESIYGNKCGTPCVVINKPHDVVMGGEHVSIHVLQNVTLFTGLLDRKGREIYGGDRIKKYVKTDTGWNDNGLPSFVVVWSDQHCGWQISKGNRHVYEIVD